MVYGYIFLTVIDERGNVEDDKFLLQHELLKHDTYDNDRFANKREMFSLELEKTIWFCLYFVGGILL